MLPARCTRLWQAGQVRAIVSSGYSNDPEMTAFKKYGFVEALPKPYAMKDLKDVLEKVITE